MEEHSFVITMKCNCNSSKLYKVLPIRIVQFYLEITVPLEYSTEYE